MWKPGDHLLAEFLLILCELNGVQKPELPEWRRLMEAEDKRLARAMSGEVNLLEGLKPYIRANRPRFYLLTRIE
jgi:hypothetical protein